MVTPAAGNDAGSVYATPVLANTLPTVPTCVKGATPPGAYPTVAPAMLDAIEALAGERGRIAFFHDPHYALVETAPLVPQRTEPGRAPARPVIDTTRSHDYVYMIRDLGSKRKPAAIICISSLIIFLILTISAYLGVVLISLFLIMPITFYIFYLAYQVQKFRQTFKPRIVGLILDFMNEQLNFTNLSYDPRQMIPKLLFQQSNIFTTPAQYYPSAPIPSRGQLVPCHGP